MIICSVVGGWLTRVSERKGHRAVTRRLNTTGPGDRKVPRGAGPWDRVCPGSFSTIPCSRSTLLKLVKKLVLEYKSTSCFLH